MNTFPSILMSAENERRRQQNLEDFMEAERICAQDEVLMEIAEAEEKALTGILPKGKDKPQRAKDTLRNTPLER
jgi:hypothetical protein